jgi:hypothetical protein
MKNDIFYKYSSLENTKKILQSKNLKLTNPNDFNDPFDCNIPTIEYDINRISKKVKKIFLKTQAKDKYISKKNWNKLFESNLLKDDLLEDFKSIKKDWNKYIGFYRILSLTTNNNNILMWSHYADSHKGVVLGFNFNNNKIKQVKYDNKNNIKIKKFLDEMFLDMFNELKIDINTKYNEDKFINKFISHLHLYFFIKNEVWNYENEYRLVLNNENIIKKPFLDFNNNQLKEIIFGIKVSKKERENFLKEFSCLDNCNIFITEEKNNKLNLVKLDNL